MSESSPAQTVLALAEDLVFASRIQSAAKSVGANVRIVRSAAEVLAQLSHGGATLLILDLNHLRGEAAQLIASARGAESPPRIVAYVSHVDQDLANAALDAGADEVLPRSRFVQVLPELLSGAGH